MLRAGKLRLFNTEAHNIEILFKIFTIQSRDGGAEGGGEGEINGSSALPPNFKQT